MGPKRVKLIAGALLLAGAIAAWPAPSLASPTDEPITVPAQDPGERLVSEFYNDLFDGRYSEALAVTDKLQVDPDNKKGQAVLATFRASALFGLKRDKEARQLMDRAEQLVPGWPEPSKTMFISGLITKRFDISADMIDQLIAKSPQTVLEIDLDSVFDLLRNQPKGEDRRNDDRRVNLARIGFGGDRAGDYFAARAVRILVKRGDTAGAAQLLGRIDDPQLIENMLIQKRFSALWPQLTKAAGPHLSNVRASSIASAESAFAAKPEDHEALQGYINALRHGGRVPDAIALRAKLPDTSGAMSSADEQMGWAVNSVALALHQAGRNADADALFALLNDSPMANGGWRVSMIINRLELLVQDGKFEQAAGLLDATEAFTKDHGSPYAKQLVRRLRYCTLSSLGKKAEASQLLPDMLAHADDAIEATVDGLLCGGEIDKAEQVAVQGLNDKDSDKREDFEADFVRALQPVPLTADDPSQWQGHWIELKRRPAIAAAYARLGRDMPADLLPPK